MVAPNVWVEEVESGEFRGSLQVGIAEGQGSVSVPLVGVAHKIEISHAVLDFGIAFVNYNEYFRLLVKNQGATVIPITVSTAAPFSIASESSFTLTSGQSKEVLVRIHPTATGSISGTVRFTSSSASFEMTARARAMTYEEYAEAMLGIFNSLTNIGYYGMAFAWDSAGTRSSRRAVLLAGFQNLDQSQVEHWLTMTESWESAPDPEQQEVDPRLQEAMDLLNSIDPLVLGGWLQELANAMTDNRFDEVYSNLLSQGLANLERVLLLILNSQSQQDARDFLVVLITPLQPFLNQPQPPLPSPQQIGKMWALSLEILAYMASTYPPWEAAEKASEFASKFFDNWLQAYKTIGMYIGIDEANRFTDKLEYIAKHIMRHYSALPKALGVPIPYQCGPGCQLMQGLSGLAQYGGIGPRQAKLTYGSVDILHNVIQPGNSNDPFDRPWTLIGIVGSTGAPFDPSVHENFFLVERITGLERNITVVARGDHCSVCTSYGEIINWIRDALYVLNQQVAATAPLPGLIQDRGIVIYVFTNPYAIGTDQALQAIESYVNQLPEAVKASTAILIVRRMPNGTVQYKCIGKGCGMYTPEELKKMACKQATGRSACAAEPWSQPSQSPTTPENQEQPTDGIMIEEPDWDETEPIDPDVLPEPRCPVCN